MLKNVDDVYIECADQTQIEASNLCTCIEEGDKMRGIRKDGNAYWVVFEEYDGRMTEVPVTSIMQLAAMLKREPAYVPKTCPTPSA